MSNKKNEQLKKEIIKDIQKAIEELRRKGLIRDEHGISEKSTTANSFEITFDGKSDANSIMYDKHISASYLMDSLLKAQQYTILLYDKSIIQAEFCIEDGNVTKERLVFLKKHNKIWDKSEIDMADLEDVDWFADEDGIPVILRVDYDPSNHVECEHAATHLTISNDEACRVPIQDVVTFSEFVRFILRHFYNVSLDMATYRFDKDSTITTLERQMIHIGWD